MTPYPALPGYEIVAPIGGGATARVFTARDLQTGDEVAVKVLREEWYDDPTALQLLRREARAGMAVEHPHLARVLEARLSAPPYFLAMDLVSGESVRQRMLREYSIEVPTAVWIARQAAEALAALHRADTIHGDVKPDNLRLVGPGTAVLIDLGFAHQSGENAAVLEAGFVLGTPNYLAPELCDPEPIDDEASDVFALGVTLFEMLTGELPYPTGNVREVMRRHRLDDAASLAEYPGPWSQGLVDLVDVMLERRHRRRPCAEQVVRELVACEIEAMPRRRAA